MNVKELSSACFEVFPVWTWDDDEYTHRPVVTTDPLPEDVGSLFIQARLQAVNGMEFKGYVIVDLCRVFAVGILVDDTEIVFNRNLPSMADHELNELFAILRTEPFPVFPLKYETRFHFAGQESLNGVFDYDKR